MGKISEGLSNDFLKNFLNDSLKEFFKGLLKEFIKKSKRFLKESVEFFFLFVEIHRKNSRVQVLLKQLFMKISTVNPEGIIARMGAQ